jgi:hypothetical protein
MCSQHYQKWRAQGDALAPHGNTKHGFSPRNAPKSPEYHSWLCMIQRCTNPKQRSYQNYGGRGIKVCERWGKFENFLADMGLRPTPEHSIERKDVNGNYEPNNCRWATKKEQARNARSNRLLTIGGRTQCLNAWAEELGKERSVIKQRLKLGWSEVDAVFTPTGPLGSNQQTYKETIHVRSRT